MSNSDNEQRTEERRLEALRSYAILDTEAEQAFDRLTALAAAFYQSPIALVSLVDRDRQWFKSKVGIDAAETPRSLAFCHHAIKGDDVFIVTDATQDPLFSDNPLVVNDPAIRFYAGALIIAPDGYRMGTLCIIDQVSRPTFGAEEAKQLKLLAEVVMSEMELRLRNRQLQKANDEAEVLQRTLVDAVSSLDGGFVYYDRNDRLVMCNDTYRAYYPKSKDLMVRGALFEDIIRAGAARGEYEISDGDTESWIAKRLENHQDADNNIEQQLSDGRWLKIAERRTPEGGTVGFRVDITELKTAQSLAERGNVAKASFFANMSHEIRTPINAVIGLSELVLQSGLSHTQQDYISKIRHAGKNLLGILNDVLDFSKIDAGMLSIEHVDFDLHDVLTDVFTLLANQAADKKIEVVFSVEHDMPTRLMGDPLRLNQILTNLANNAIKFTSVGEVVVYVDVVDWTTETATIRFRIRDTGIGMDEEQREKLFVAFQQADDSISRKHGGTGLGLAICKRLVDAMEGTIQIESTPGEGFVFTVVLPFQRSDNANDADTRFSTVSDNIRALICDDNQTSRDVLASMLHQFGLRTESVSRGEDAVQVIADTNDKDSFGLIVLDASMPDGLSGLETATEIQNKAGGKDIPIIMMSAPFEVDQPSIAAFVEKPISTPVIHDAVMRIFSPASVLGDLDQPNENAGAPIQASVSGAKILLAEDNELNQIVACGILESAGFIVDIANDGQEAVDTLLSNNPRTYAAVLMDIQMPGIDGLTATKMIREKAAFTTLPIIAITAHALAEERERCLKVGMNDHLAKPFNPRDLVTKLNAWMLLSARPDTTDEGDPASIGSAVTAIQAAVELPSANDMDDVGPYSITEVAERLYLPVMLCDLLLKNLSHLTLHLVMI